MFARHLKGLFMIPNLPSDNCLPFPSKAAPPPRARSWNFSGVFVCLSYGLTIEVSMCSSQSANRIE